jgi:hypothetical protein
MTEALYLYAITGAPGLSLPEVHGIEGGVTLLEHDGLAAIVGAPPSSGFQGLSREQAVRLLLSHQEVIEAAMGKTTVLPAKFGTIAPSKAAVRSLLGQERDTLAQLLVEFGGCMQMEIVVLWQKEAIFAEIAAEPAIARARKEVAKGGGEAAAVELGKAVKAELDKKRAGVQARLEEELRPVAEEIAFNAPMDDRMAANMAVLVKKREGKQLDAALERLDAAFEGRLTFRCVGPLPPSSFATLQATFPSAQTIARARLTLELTGPLSRKEIVSAFRRLAREHHPDLAGKGDSGNEHMEELTAAYRLLLACAASRQNSSAGDEHNVPVLLEVAGRRYKEPQERQRGAA